MGVRFLRAVHRDRHAPEQTGKSRRNPLNQASGISDHGRAGRGGIASAAGGIGQPNKREWQCGRA
jgi:hypothetical protein